MSIRDRINSFLNGGFVDAPSGGSSSECDELRLEVEKFRHDFEHLHGEHMKALGQIALLKNQNATLLELGLKVEGKLVAAEAVILANGLKV